MHTLKDKAHLACNFLCEFQVIKGFHEAVITTPSNTVNNESAGFIHLG